MRKKIVWLTLLLTVCTTNLKAISDAEVEFTVNVTDDMSIKQIKPIDFGNLLRGSEGVQTQREEGVIAISSTDDLIHDMEVEFGQTAGISLRFQTDTGMAGDAGTKETIDDITLVPIGYVFDLNKITVTDVGREPVLISIGATFVAGEATDNLTSTQKIGKYKGKVALTVIKI